MREAKEVDEAPGALVIQVYVRRSIVYYFNREGRRTRARRSRLMMIGRHHFQQHVMAVITTDDSLVDNTAESDASLSASEKGYQP